jgi:hypothetical protein
MVTTIVVMLALTILAAARLLAPKVAPGRVLYDNAPDRPKPFGYRMAWLAIRSRDPRLVAERLGLDGAAPCNWDSGLGSVYDLKLGQHMMFVSPPVNGWVFVCGLALPHPVGPGFVDKVTPLLVDLGGRFAEVQYFYTYPPIDLFAWARLIDGRLVRAFAAGDEGILWNKGRIGREERELGLKMFELRGVRGRVGDAGGEMILHPTEEQVLQMARKWSIDPTALGSMRAEPGLGLIANAPLTWRSERIRRAA